MPYLPLSTFRLALIAGLALLAAACGSPSTSAPPTQAPVATSAPAPAAVPAAQPAAAPTSAPAAAPTQPAAQPSVVPAAQAAADGVRLTLLPDASEARFRAREQLVGRTLPNEAVGSTPNVSGEIAIGHDGAIAGERSIVTVDLRTLKSDESRRDNWIQRNTLQTQQFPTAQFVVRSAPGLAAPLPTSGETTFQLVGDLTVHGVTRPTSWDVTARFAEQEVQASAWARMKMTDFAMTPPQAGPVLSIEDELTIELDVRAVREPTSTSTIG